MSGCGTTTQTVPSAKTPLTVSAPSRLCPPSDEKPRRILLKSAGDVLVAGHPTGAVLCRYWGYSGRKPEPEDERAHIAPGEGEHGHLIRTLAEARRITRQDVTSYLASELDALPHLPRAAEACDVATGDRSELIIFHYRGGGESRIVVFEQNCDPVANGRIVRAGFGAGHESAGHWWDEALL